MNDAFSDDFVNAFEAAFARLQVALLEACEPQEEWSGKVAAGIRGGLEFAAAEPGAIQLLTTEALAGGEDGIARHQRLLGFLAERLRPGRDESPDGERLPEFIERAMAGGLLMLVSQRVDRGSPEDLPTLASEAIQFVLTPYLGTAEARRIGAEHGASRRPR